METFVSFPAERDRHHAIVGRDDVLKELHLLTSADSAPTDRGWVLIKAGPGRGKSAILSSFLTQLEMGTRSTDQDAPTSSDSGKPSPSIARIPQHFIRRGYEGSDRWEGIVRSLTLQIEARFPEQKEYRNDDHGQLWALLRRVSERVLRPANDRLVIVVDGLDEAAPVTGDVRTQVNPLPSFLPFVLPYGVYFVCASRPHYPHLAWVEAKEHLCVIDLDCQRWSVSNRAASAAFWDRERVNFLPQLTHQFVSSAIERGEGNLLYAVKLRDWLRDQESDVTQAIRLPKGLEAFIQLMWDRLREGDHVGYEHAIEGLGILAVAQESLTLAEIAEALAWNEMRFKEDFLSRACHFLLEETRGWLGGHDTTYRLYHESIRDFIVKKLGRNQLQELHAKLAMSIAAWPTRFADDDHRRRYVLRYGLCHRLEAEDWKGVKTLCADTQYLESVIREHGIGFLETLLDETSLLVPAGQSKDELIGVARAVRSESHWLRAFPAALGSILYNRLRAYGWARDKIDQVLFPPPSGPLLRHPVCLGRNELRTLGGHTDHVTAIALSGDGAIAVSASKDATLIAWDLRHGTEPRCFRGHTQAISAVALSEDGTLAVSAADDRTLKMWDINTGTLIRTLGDQDPGITALAVSNDNLLIVCRAHTNTIHVLNLNDDTLCYRIHGVGSVTSISICHSTSCAALGSMGGTIWTWNIHDGSELCFIRHAGRVECVALSGNGLRIASVSNDKSLKIWDLETASLRQDITRDIKFNTVAISEDGRIAVSGSSDKLLRVWDLSAGTEQNVLSGHSGNIGAVAINSKGDLAISAGIYSSELKVWNLQNKADKFVPPAHSSCVSAIAISSDGKLGFSASSDGALKIWDLASATVRSALLGHSSGIQAVAISGDGRLAVSGCADGKLKFWDMASGAERILSFGEGEPLFGEHGIPHYGPVEAVALNFDGTLLATASPHRSYFEVWEIEGNNVGHAWAGGHGLGQVFALAISPAGRLVSGSLMGTVHSYDLARPTHVEIKAHSTAVNAVAISFDGKFAVSTSRDQLLKVWNLETGAEIHRFAGHNSDIAGVAFSKDNSVIVSASSDCTLKIWSLKTNSLAWTVYGGSGFECVAIANETIIAGDRAGNVWIIDLPSLDGKRALGERIVNPKDNPSPYLDGSSDHTARFEARPYVKSQSRPLMMPFLFDDPDAVQYAASRELGEVDKIILEKVLENVLAKLISDVRIDEIAATIKQIFVYSTLVDDPQRSYYRLVGLLAIAKEEVGLPVPDMAGRGFLRPLNLAERKKTRTENEKSEHERIHQMAQYIGVKFEGSLKYNTVCAGYRRAYKSLHGSRADPRNARSKISVKDR
ncbi:MAG: NACHT and WD repeat domain-containing protein [Phycisphaerales bacterium]